MLAASLALLFTGVSTAAFASNAQPARDAGAANPAQKVNVTLVMQLHNQQALESYIYKTVTPGNANYHRFLTTAQFADRYGPTDAEIARVQGFLKQHGLSTGKLLPSHMAIQVSGTLGQFSAAFHTPIHDYIGSDGQRFHRPTSQPVMPAALAGTLVVASGLSNEAHYVPHNISVKRAPVLSHGVSSLAKLAPASGTASGVPGEYTVGDVANFYDVNPLYKAGINGKGSTIGIVTLADFVEADACAYWKLIGLKTKPNRITKIPVDGGGVLSGAAGSGETSLDVEQSGGLAPYANIRVYHAPNTDAGFIDAFFTAVSDNIADSISVSWGQPEIFYFPELNNADYTTELRAFHQAFLEAAVQGISMFAASGDSGAYDTVRALGHTNYSAPLTVDAPSSDPFITAAGGTTLPFTYAFSGGPTASITRESVWGWSYIQNYFDTNFGPGLIDLFAVGGGGGVSVFWRKPFYQNFTHGIRTSQPHQSLDYLVGTPQTLLKLPGHFAGRNVPDISLNADPETGYLIVSSTDSPDPISGFGGTSFVAPQLNGITALLRQSSGRRVGFWNPQVYALQNIFGYGPYAAFRDIKAGDNWFYQGKRGYEPGAGIGVLDATNLAILMHAGF
jgi:subtilase family serine protease